MLFLLNFIISPADMTDTSVPVRLLTFFLIFSASFCRTTVFFRQFELEQSWAGCTLSQVSEWVSLTRRIEDIRCLTRPTEKRGVEDVIESRRAQFSMVGSRERVWLRGPGGLKRRGTARTSACPSLNSSRTSECPEPWFCEIVRSLITRPPAPSLHRSHKAH